MDDRLILGFTHFVDYTCQVTLDSTLKDIWENNSASVIVKVRVSVSAGANESVNGSGSVRV